MSHSTQTAFGQIVILTGAGVSAESGLSTFRDADGLWENHDPMEIATPEAFRRDPQLVYRFYNARRAQLSQVKPNAAHEAIAQLQQACAGDVFLVTQNVDDLHERGGSEQVCHMHGELASQWCTHCDSREPTDAAFDNSSRCKYCEETGGVRPDIVWFGEIPYHMPEIERRLSQCDLFVAIGTSGAVYPAAGFVQFARQCGAHTLELNKEPSDVVGQFAESRCGLASELVPAWVDSLLVAG